MDFDPTVPATLVPWISVDWKMNFKWRGDGAMPDAEQKRLGEIAVKAHVQGRRGSVQDLCEFLPLKKFGFADNR